MSDDPDRDAARARLDVVRQRFAARLAARIVELVDRIDAARSGAAPIADAVVLAHRLAGTAGSYGYDEAGEQARRLELALVDVGEGGAWDAVDASLAELRGLSP